MGLNGFTEWLFSALLSWMQIIYNWFWSMLATGGQNEFMPWFSDNWLTIVGVLLIAGLVVDYTIYLMRWQPYHVWLTTLRRARGYVSRPFVKEQPRLKYAGYRRVLEGYEGQRDERRNGRSAPLDARPPQREADAPAQVYEAAQVYEPSQHIQVEQQHGQYAGRTAVQPLEPDARADGEYAAEQRADDQRSDAQYMAGRYADGQDPDAQYAAGRYADGQGPDVQYAAGRYADGQGPDAQYAAVRYADGQGPDAQYVAGQYADGQYADGRHADEAYPAGQYSPDRITADQYTGSQYPADPQPLVADSTAFGGDSPAYGQPAPQQPALDAEGYEPEHIIAPEDSAQLASLAQEPPQADESQAEEPLFGEPPQFVRSERDMPMYGVYTGRGPQFMPIGIGENRPAQMELPEMPVFEETVAPPPTAQPEMQQAQAPAQSAAQHQPQSMGKPEAQRQPQSTDKPAAQEPARPARHTGAHQAASGTRLSPASDMPVRRTVEGYESRSRRRKARVVEQQSTQQVQATQPAQQRPVQATQPAQQRPIQATQPAQQRPVQATQPTQQRPVQASQLAQQRPVQATQPAQQRPVQYAPHTIAVQPDTHAPQPAPQPAPRTIAVRKAGITRDIEYDDE